MLKIRENTQKKGGKRKRKETGRRQITVTTISNLKKKAYITSQLTNEKYPRGLERWLSR